MKTFKRQPALLTRIEIKWLLNRARISKGYEYRIRSDIKKKIKTFAELEIPLLIEKGFLINFDLSIYNQNLRTNSQTECENISQLPSNTQICAQNMVGRKGRI